MSEATPRERLNVAAELLGLPERLAPECGQAQWTDVLTKVVVALAQASALMATRPSPVAARSRVVRRRSPVLPKRAQIQRKRRTRAPGPEADV
jgi:hypothetical protein